MGRAGQFRWGLIIACFAAPLFCAAGEFESARSRMIQEQIQARGIRNALVLESMRSTPRHLFVPEPYRFRAYGDHPLPIGYGQTISQPYIVALMTELLDPRRGDRVLEVGTGSGYQAAVLSRIAKEVYTIEIVPELARNSAAVLKQLGYRNVFVREGDGYKGWPEKAPFDRIIVTCAPVEVPKALTDQLKAGGKLVAPIGEALQQLVVVEKRRDGSLDRKATIPVRFVPMVPGPK
jgi:protein-L-isoaspartate(D-aspartate) O-methyltransferase